jgi:uncharacterized protein YecT (DUF1311 family)
MMFPDRLSEKALLSPSTQGYLENVGFLDHVGASVVTRSTFQRDHSETGQTTVRTQLMILGVCATLALCGPAQGGEASSRVFAACDAQLAGGSYSMVDYLRCADLQLDVVERRLTEAYNAALERARRYQAAKQVTNDQKPSDALLREAQRKWIEFRDANCAMHVDLTSSGGSARHNDILVCRIDAVSARIDELNQLYR